jgi:hypothetical protein
MDISPLLTQMRTRPWWETAISSLRQLVDERYGAVETRIERYAAVYDQRRAAMVFDVVASRRRNYERRVRRLVGEFEQRPAAASLAALAETGPGKGLSLGPREEITIQRVAAALHRYCTEHSLSDDQGVKRWALDAEPLRLAPRLDPYAGRIKGIGVALFAYLRMRSGADAIKPDTRIRSRLTTCRFDVPTEDRAVILLGEAAAEELGVTRFALDQLLW